MQKTKKILSALLALVMVIGIMPAAAFASPCELEEHTHGEGCYTLTCELSEHSHTACDLSCDKEAHTHCYDDKCEIEAHEHTACDLSCDKEAHAHCYTFTCEKAEHKHNEECADEEVVYVAQIGTTQYETLQAAADVGGSIKLLADVTESVVVAKDATIDLNGFDVISAGDAFEITAGTLTINGEGVVAGGSTGVGSWTAIWANGGKAILNGGTYAVGGDSSTTDVTHQNDVIYTKNGGSVVINGGYFENDGTVWTLNENDANRGTIVVKGGTFENWDPANNVSEGPATNFVADGYVSVKSGNNYVVRAKVDAQLITNLEEVDFVVGEPAEFTFSTIANDDAGVMVVGLSDFNDPDALAKLEYYEPNTDSWYDLNGAFGGGNGFPMADATSKFRATFAKAGEFTFTSVMKTVDGGEILCSVEATAVVREPVAAPKDFVVISLTSATAHGHLEYESIVTQGDDLVITVVPDEGYELESLYVNDEDVTEYVVDSQYIVEDVQEDVYVKAEFAAITDELIYITDIDITVDAPVVGATPAQSVSVELSPEFELDTGMISFEWYVGDTDDIDYGEWNMLFADEEFEEDKFYALIVQFIVHDGATIDEDYIARVNGEEILWSMTEEGDGDFYNIAFAGIHVFEALPAEDEPIEPEDPIEPEGPVVPEVEGYEVNCEKEAHVHNACDLSCEKEAHTHCFSDKCEENHEHCYVKIEDEPELPDAPVVFDNVAITVEAPEVGKKLSIAHSISSTIPGWDSTKSELLWLVNGKEAAEDYIVKAGDVHTICLLIALKDGYVPADEIDATLNGQPVDVTVYEDEDTGLVGLVIVHEFPHEHKLTKVEAKKETCTEKGNSEYFTCECGKWFKDDKAETEIVDKTSVEIKAAGHKAATEWSRDAKSHWHKCTVCKEPADEKVAHNFDKETGKICQTCKYDVDNPKTGSEAHITAMAAVMTLSVVVMAGVAAYFVWDKKRKQ